MQDRVKLSPHSHSQYTQSVYDKSCIIECTLIYVSFGAISVRFFQEENEELRVQIQSLEESLADARASLAREREFAEMVSQDDEKSAAQQV